MPRISLKHKPPSHGWLPLELNVEGRIVEIDASDVPNNPIHELVAAIDSASLGTPGSVWWNLEPDGYFMRFAPLGQEVEFRLEFAPRSEVNRSHLVLSAKGRRSEILLPFWRFLREFQSHSYQEPHWPSVVLGRINAIKAHIVAQGVV